MALSTSGGNKLARNAKDQGFKPLAHRKNRLKSLSIIWYCHYESQRSKFDKNCYFSPWNNFINNKLFALCYVLPLGTGNKVLNKFWNSWMPPIFNSLLAYQWSREISENIEVLQRAISGSPQGFQFTPPASYVTTSSHFVPNKYKRNTVSYFHLVFEITFIHKLLPIM